MVAEGTPLSLGCLGVTSNGDAYRYLAEHADLLIFLGAGFNERTSYLWDTKLLANKKIAQVDRDAAQLGRVFQPDVAICDDIRCRGGRRVRHAGSGRACRPNRSRPARPPARGVASAEPPAASRGRCKLPT